MPLKDLTIDQNALEENLIENLISPYLRYDLRQKSIVFLRDKLSSLSISQKIVLYLLALRGWQYFKDASDTAQYAKPKDIAVATGENGSSIRTNLQVLLKMGLIQKN